MPAHREQRRAGLRDVFARPSYRRLWIARTVSQWGDIFNFVALALVIYGLTGSSLGVSGVVAAEILPVLLFAPLAGPLVDRWPRVRVMVGANLARLILALVLATWHEASAALYVVAFGMSVGDHADRPVDRAVPPVTPPVQSSCR